MLAVLPDFHEFKKEKLSRMQSDCERLSRSGRAKRYQQAEGRNGYFLNEDIRTLIGPLN